jgi:hypothetical protein
MYVCVGVRERERERERESFCVCEIRSGANNLKWRRTFEPIQNTHTHTHKHELNKIQVILQYHI